jgi:hypothetical protein
VEVLRRYAKLPYVISQIRITRRVVERASQRPKRLATAPSRPYALPRRLGATQVQELMRAYRAGTPSPELAEHHGVAKSALLQLLHHEGLAIRKPGMTPKQITEARRLRDQGLSYAAIGKQLGFVGSTVWRGLVRPDP